MSNCTVYCKVTVEMLECSQDLSNFKGAES